MQLVIVGCKTRENPLGFVLLVPYILGCWVEFVVLNVVRLYEKHYVLCFQVDVCIVPNLNVRITYKNGWTQTLFRYWAVTIPCTNATHGCCSHAPHCGSRLVKCVYAVLPESAHYTVWHSGTKWHIQGYDNYIRWKWLTVALSHSLYITPVPAYI